MTIERDGQGQIEFTCDDCGTESFGPADSFEVLKEDAYQAGWRTHKRDGEWQQACPQCVENWKLGRGDLL